MFQKLVKRVNRKEESGFTLIELLMVIVILAILAAVVVFSLAGLTDKGQKSACKADYNTLVTAVEAHYADPGFGTWANETTLKADKFLATESPNYDITATATGYTIAAAGGGKCGTFGIPPA
ncbi:MAG: type IV pilin protein [Acidimicrobiales bacterium]